MSNINKQALRWKAEKATQGEWWSDSCGNEGIYGSGDDCVEGFTSYAVYDENNRILLDTLNSTAVCINEEYDGEGHVAWDEVGQLNAEFIATANPATVLALLDELEAAEKRIAELEARTVTLPNPYPKGYGLVADKYNFALEECADAIRAAGISIKGE